MALLLIRHRVTDYEAWRKVYDSVSDVPAFSNITSESVHRMVDDPNNVLVLHYFDSVDEARAFTALPELQEAMQRAGVQGEPSFEYYE
jgi:heme-degrading monooxygenase HmoA